MFLDGGNNAVTDELKAQVRELQKIMRVMMEERRPAFGSDGGYQEAVPPRPAAASSGHMSAPGTLLVSHVRTTAPPKYDGIDKSKYVLWKREFFHTSSNRDVGRCKLYSVPNTGGFGGCRGKRVEGDP